MDEILKQFNLTTEELKEYKKLNKKIFGTGKLKSLFVVLDLKDKEHARLNELAGKVVKLNAYLLTHRNGKSSQQLIDLL